MKTYEVTMHAKVKVEADDEKTAEKKAFEDLDLEYEDVDHVDVIEK